MELKEIVSDLISKGYHDRDDISIRENESFQELQQIAKYNDSGLAGKEVFIRYIPFNRYTYEGLRISRGDKYNTITGKVVNDTFKQIYISSKEEGFHIIPYQCIVELHEYIENKK